MSVDVLLANPLFLSKDPVEARLMEPYFPLGVLYIAAVLRQQGLGVAVFDATFEPDERAFARALARLSPRYVGITAQNITRGTARRMAQIAREAGALVVFGGPDPTSRPADYLGQDLAEIVVIGEGEATAAELFSVLEAHGGRRPPDSALCGIAGLAYLHSATSDLVLTSRRPAIRQLDTVPFPARDLIDVERYRRAWRDRHGSFALSIITSRGCPFHCNWCAKPVFGRLYQQRSPQNVVAELAMLQREYKPDRLRVLDDIFPLNRKWLRSWHAEVLAQQAAIPFECLSRVDLVDREILQMLKEAGCWKICYGAESGSQKVLDAMDKGTSIDQIYRAVAAMREVGIDTYFFIMLGYPGEEWEDIELTRKLLRDTTPERFSVSVAYPLPGTRFYENVRDRLGEKQDWAYTSENAVLFSGARYSTRFYHAVERLLHREVDVIRARRGLDKVGTLRQLRIEVELLALRPAVQALRLADGRRTAFRPATAGGL